MDTATAQKAFDRICKHLRVQGRPSPSSYEPGTVGALRGPDGLKDAVGCLIPDEEYREDLEMGEAHSWVTIGNRFEVPSLRKYSAEFLDRLVTIHDDSLCRTCEPGYVVEKGLHDLGQEFGLDVQEVYGFKGWGKVG